MLVQDFVSTAEQRLSRLNGLLEQIYGIAIDYGSGREHIEQVHEHYNSLRTMLAEHGIAGLQHDQRYAKAVLISEATRLFLREIAPKRTRKPKR